MDTLQQIQISTPNNPFTVPNLTYIQPSSINGLSNIINNIGSKLVNSYGTEYGSDLAYQKIVDNLQKGVNGDYSHISSFTQVGKAYNSIMDKLAPAVISSSISSKLIQSANDIRDSSSIPASDKVKTFAKSSTELINNTLQQIQEPSQKVQVGLLLTQEAGQQQKNLISHVAAIQSNQQKYVAIQSLNEQNILAQQAASKGNLPLFNNYLHELYNTIDAGIETGLYSSVQANNLKQNYKLQAFSQLAVSQGIAKVKDLNNQFAKEDQLTEFEISKLQNLIKDKQLQALNQIKINQLLSGYDFESDLSKARAGITTAPSMQLTPEQYTQFRENANAGEQVRALQSMSPVQQSEKLQTDSSYLSLPPHLQNYVMSTTRTYNNEVNHDPVSMLGLSELNGEQRMAKMQAYGVKDPINKVVSPMELNQLANAYLGNPEKNIVPRSIETLNYINQKFGRFAGPVIDQLAKVTKQYGINSANPLVRNDYLIGSSIGGTGRTITQEDLSSYSNTYSELLPTTRSALSDIIKQTSKVNPQLKTKDLIKKYYYIDNNGNFLAQGHQNVLNDFGKFEIANYITQISKEKIKPEYIQSIQLDPQTNTYIIKTSTNHIQVPYSVINDISVKDDWKTNLKENVGFWFGKVKSSYEYMENVDKD